MISSQQTVITMQVVVKFRSNSKTVALPDEVFKSEYLPNNY